MTDALRSAPGAKADTAARSNEPGAGAEAAARSNGPGADGGLATAALHELAASPARPVEIELKYRPKTLAAGERYLLADAVGGFHALGPPRTVRFEDRYVDTADGALARGKFAARLRRSAKGTIVSVKSTGRRRSAGGAHRREELEGPADPVMPPRDWPASEARSLVLELCGDRPLTELVTVRQERRRRKLRDGDTTLELSLDDVEVVAAGQVVDRWLELEIELVRGDDAGIEAVAAALAPDPELAPARRSKLQSALAGVRGHVRRNGPPAAAAGSTDGTAVSSGHARGGETAAPKRTAAERPAAERPAAKSPGVSAEDHVAEAGRKVLRFHFARMLTREPGTREGVAVEELHGMRVATRRMRAAWRIFGFGFRPDRTKKLRNRLRDVAARLGAVRDLDVLLEAGETYRKELSATEQRGLEPLFASWRSERDAARAILLRELDSDGYRRFVDDYRQFVDTDGAAVLEAPATAPHHIRDTAPSRIWAAYEGVRAYESVLRWADVETLHDLRIAAKWLRYSLEFVREPLGPEAEQLVPRVTALQDHLGWMHDADVAAARARRFLVDRAGSLTTAENAAIGRYLVSREREVARLRRSVGGPWRGVAGLAFRRRLGRAVGNL
ncbi:MAG: CHAD domain-containing protein [Chloroflexi bacterium]|nr:CHAD domain-containing protein [Chloroflexota bacterium]